MRPRPGNPFDHPSTRERVREALREDLGRGDVTTQLTVDEGARGRARLVAREPCVVAGLPLLAVVYEELGGGGVVSVTSQVREGSRVEAGRTLARVEGPLGAILAGERVVLNFLQQLAGTATLTRRFVDAIEGTRSVILDTRKTLPGLRLLQKYAVRVGGGRNHRFGLDDGILIKDNHIVACGSIRAAVERARAGAPHGLRVEVECDRLEQVEEAIEAGAEVLLLDNMTPAMVARARDLAGGRVTLEVSGSIDLRNVRRYAERGEFLISVGALTHSAPAIDLALDVRARSSGRSR